MKPTLLILTIAFCLKPISTHAVISPSIDNETVWQFAIAAYKVGLEDGKAIEAEKSVDLPLKRLTIQDATTLLEE